MPLHAAATLLGRHTKTGLRIGNLFYYRGPRKIITGLQTQKFDPQKNLVFKVQ